MRIFDLIKMCARNLFRRKVRTLLTVTGVIIGTCSIMVMVSIGVGLNQSSEADMATYTDLTAITVYAPDSGSPTMPGSGHGKMVKLDDRALMQMERLEHVVAATPVMNLNGSFVLRCGDYTASYPEIVAIDLGKAELFGYETTSGALAGTDDMYAVMFGAETAYNFGNDETGEWPVYEYDDQGNICGNALVDPMSEKVTIAAAKEEYNEEGGLVAQTFGTEHELNVSGILKGDWAREGSVWGIVISLELAQQLAREVNELNANADGMPDTSTTYSAFKIKVDDVDNVAAVEDVIKTGGYQTSSATEFREAMQKQARITQIVLGGLGAIAMLVAALGIANTMIMSIYERTREIGVMKVLGCQLKDIRLMFLIEAGGIGLIGGVFGVILSYVLSFILNIIGTSLLEISTEATFRLSVIPFWLVLLGMLFAVGVGLLAGFYPANRAVRISALSAIRQPN